MNVFIRSSVLLLLILLCVSPAYARIFSVTMQPGGKLMMTDSIQKAIDKCAREGGGSVRFAPGIYLTGTLFMKSNVSLQLEQGAVIQGSSNYADYKEDAFIYGNNLTNIAITGPGKIDGVNCYNSKGEEGFRGPHCIRLINCKTIQIKNITITNSANWAINCRYCTDGIVDDVSIRGGHDGLHTRFCDNFTVTDCDFRTGDDAFAGNDNRNFLIKGCKINTSCSAFRMGCLNFTVQHCRIWGPGEYVHRIENRANMPVAFVHFSPKDENTKIQSGNWLIQDIVIDSATYVYMYNYENGLWQTGQPATSITFDHVTATNLMRAFYVIGDHDRKFNLTITNASFKSLPGKVMMDTTFEDVKLKSDKFFYGSDFDLINLQDVIFEKNAGAPLINCRAGNKVLMKRLSFKTNTKALPYMLDTIDEVIIDHADLNK